jgi:hypothetical protein
MNATELVLRRRISTLEAQVQALIEVVREMAEANKPPHGNYQLFDQSIVDKAVGLDRVNWEE